MAMGDALRSSNGPVRPLFHFPKTTKKTEIVRASNKGAGSHFEKHEGGVQGGQPGRRGAVSKRNETKKPSPSQIICDLAIGMRKDCLVSFRQARVW